MDVKLKPFDFAQAVAKAGMPQVAERVRAGARAAGVSNTDTQPSEVHGFSQVFSQALRSVSEAQQVAQQMQQDVAQDSPTVSIEQTMVAMQRSQIGFQAAMQVRNRMVQAYSDIMNMQV
jgi:flagellar hook-basal body complex protein FliE